MYLDLDELLQPVDDGDVLVAARLLGHDDLVAGAQPAAVLVPDEGLVGGLFVVEVAQHDRGRLHEQLARLAVLGDLLAVGVDDLAPCAGHERAGCSCDDVVFACRGDDC